MKNLRNKGISLISLTVAVCILIVISSMLIYNAKSGVNIRKLKMMQNDIATLDDAINSYYAKYGALPVKIEYNVMPLPFFNDISPNDNEVYYVIDLTALEGITLNYGVDYEHINTQEDLLENEDVYVINEQSHRIYYARGIEMDGVVYYTNEQDEDVELHQRQWSQAILDDKGDMYALDTFGELYMINIGYSGNIQENKNYIKLSDFWKDALILQGKDIIDISAGYNCTAAVDQEGKVYTWGYNDNGQLGNGTTIDSKIPICISDISGNILNGKKIKQIAVGESHTVALDEQGKVYTWGYNYFGQLGDGTETDSRIPICISDISGNPLQTKTIIQVVVGENHTVVLDEQGKVYTWGWNFYGELGDGIIAMGPGGNYSNSPICISDIPEHPLQTKIITQISARDEYTAVLDQEGKVYTWGLNSSGQLGDGTTESKNTPQAISDIPGNKLNGKKIVQVSLGNSHSVAIDQEGQVYTWGNNDYGKLGDGTTEIGYNKHRSTPKCISEVAESLQGKKIVNISAGGIYTIAVDEKGQVYTWGDNYYGELGDGITEMGPTKYRETPICISEIAEHVFFGKKIRQISAGSYHAIVMDEEGRIYTWGANTKGQLVTGSLIDSDLPISINISGENKILGKKIVKIASSGNGRILALDEQGKLYTWGANCFGQLGDGTIKNRGLPKCITDINNEENDMYNKKIVDVSGNYYHTVALDEDGKVYTWGNNYNGLLGNGSNDDEVFPKCISKIESEDNDLYKYNKKIVKISAGEDFTVALDEDGKVYTWGKNYDGVLGNGSNDDEVFPKCISEIESEDNDLYKYNKKIVDISAGDYHVVALDEEGKVYSWGALLGIEDGATDYGIFPKCISEISGHVFQDKKIIQISAGYAHSIALDEYGNVYAWGWNLKEEYQFNTPGLLGSEEYSYVPVCANDISGSILKGRKIKKIEANAVCSVIIDDKGNMMIFGTWGGLRIKKL